MKRWKCLLLVATLGMALGVLPAVRAQTKEHPSHQELRDLMKEMVAAHNAGDLDKLITALDDDVVVTWQNGKVTKGPKAVKAYYEEMTKGPNRVVDKSTIKPEADELSILSNDGKTAFSWGNSKDHYVLTSGIEFDQDTRWSATVTKKDGKWKVTSVHISVNMFDNPILDLVHKKLFWTGLIVGLSGLLLGLLIGSMLFRGKAPAAPTTPAS
jgi:uncharacterized protein (TIGR02246 family)